MSRSRPVIDGVEGTYAKAPAQDPNRGEVRRQCAGQAARRRHPAPQGLARHQGRPARPAGKAGRHASSPPRKSKSSKKTSEPQVRHRHRPRHHQLRRSPTRKSRADADPFAPAERAAAADSATREPGRSARRRLCCPRSSTCRARRISRPAASRCPGTRSRDYVVGRLAQKRGVENAGRLVSSAKSWLSHSGVDRTAPLLPFRAPEGVDEDLARGGQPPLPGAPARGVGHEDARRAVRRAAGAGHRARIVRRRGARTDAATPREQAGYQNITLLEEPQAAFYAWIERHPDWRERVAVGDLILVVDIGGGTTDFTLIAVTEAKRRTVARPRRRGRAHPARRRQHGPRAGRRGGASAGGKGHEHRQPCSSRRCGHNCRVAKEKLLRAGLESQGAAGHDSRQRHGPGGRHDQGHAASRATSSRCSAMVSSRRSRAPRCPQRQRRVGLQEIGLPYAADAAITRHMARFLRQQASTAEHGAVRRGPSGLACPTHVLFNGGVLQRGPGSRAHPARR